jgi:two-component system chemotaxis response regulator CheB
LSPIAPRTSLPASISAAASATGTVASADQVRVMLCDDSAVIRAVIARALEADPGIRVVARAGNGRAALAALKPGAVDVLVLDIEMPEMDGLTALPLLLKVDPGLRIIMASTLTTRGADIALRALRLGAADYIPKPSATDLAGGLPWGDELAAKVKGLARLRRRAVAATVAPGAAVPLAAPAVAAIALRAASKRPPVLLAIGSSTGGPQALFTLIQGLGKSPGVPVVLTQHMPATFTAILAEHITKLGFMPCAEAVHGEKLVANRIYLAPGSRHLLVQGTVGGLVAQLSDGEPENFCRPAVDPMVRTATVATGGRTLLVMLTGMGHDGLAGTQALIAAGGTAIAQDEATSVVWGMPGAIARAGLCHAVLPLPALAQRVDRLLRGAPC